MSLMIIKQNTLSKNFSVCSLQRISTLRLYVDGVALLYFKIKTVTHFSSPVHCLDFRSCSDILIHVDYQLDTQDREVKCK